MVCLMLNFSLLTVLPCVMLLNKKQSALTVFHNSEYKTGFDIISYVIGAELFPHGISLSRLFCIKGLIVKLFIQYWMLFVFIKKN